MNRAIAGVVLGGASCAWGQTAAVVPWWQDAVFYEIFVRSFKDSSTGPLAGDGVGDFQGLIERLDYLNDGDPKTDTDLGVTGIWLMPIKESRSYHGYDVDDYYACEKDYGTNADFKQLVEECHKRGIRVIIDLVLNHASKDNAWFKESFDPKSPKHDWFVWRDADPKWKGPWGQDVWHRVNTPAGERWYYGIFSSYMPDINYDNPAASAQMLDVVRHWLTEYKIDGYRLDAIKYLDEDGPKVENLPKTHEWLRTFYQEYKKVNPNAFTIGEIWDSPENASRYVPDQLDTAFEFSLSDAMIAAARDGDAMRLIEAQGKVDRLYPRNHYGRFLSNHDQTRVMTQLKGDEGAMRVAAALMLLGPGTPFVYYGEELGMVGDKPDENLRTPMPWTAGAEAGFTKGKAWMPPQPGFEKVNVEAQAKDSGSLLNWYKNLIRLRRGSEALSHGELRPVTTNNPHVLAFLRVASDERTRKAAMVVVNLGKEAARGVELSIERSPMLGGVKAREVLHGTSVKAPVFADHGNLTAYVPVDTLEGRGVVVIELEGK